MIKNSNPKTSVETTVNPTATDNNMQTQLRELYAENFNQSMDDLRIDTIEKYVAERLRSSAEVLRRKADRSVGETPEWVLTERKLALISERLIKADEERKERGELTFAEHVSRFVKNLAVKAAWRLANPKTRSKRELDESIEIKSLESVVVNSFEQNELGEISWSISDNGAVNHSKSARYELFASDVEEVEGVVWRWLQPIWPQVVAHFERFGTFQWDKSKPESKFTLEGDELFAFWKNVFSESRTALEITRGGRALRMKCLRPTVSLDAIEWGAIRAMEEARLSEYVYEQQQITEGEHEDIRANYDSLNMVEMPWVEHCERKEAARMERLAPDILNAKTLAERWINSANQYNPSRKKKDRFTNANNTILALYHATPEACEPVWLDGKNNPEYVVFKKQLSLTKMFMLFGEGMEAIEEAKQVVAASPFRTAKRALRPLSRIQSYLTEALALDYPSQAVLDEARSLVTKAQMLLDAVLSIAPCHSGSEIVDNVMAV